MDIIEQINQTLSEKNISIRQFAKDLTHYLPNDGFEGFYQRHHRILTGDYKNIEDFEAEAYQNWLLIETNTHQINQSILELIQANPEKKLTQAQKWLSSGIFNPTQARRLTNDLTKMIRRVQAFYE